MKHFIWMLCGIFLSGLLLGSLSACGADQFGTTMVTTRRATSDSGPASPVEEDASGGSAASEDSTLDEIPAEFPDEVPVENLVETPAKTPALSESEARNIAYGKVLWDAYLRGVLPDGSALDYIDMEAAAMNDFALYDVDGDGQEELILLWANAGVAGMWGIVYGYRNDTVYVELSEFVDLTFYNSGIVDASWSHNQGLGGRFWPYNLYHYNNESGVYELVGAVDAWDMTLRDTDYNGAFFPTDIDRDGDGLIYYLLPSNWEGQYSTASMVDGPDHENWRNTYIDGGEIISLPRQKLTEDNIAALGCPKPDVPISTPAG